MEKYKNDVERVFPARIWVIYIVLFAFSIPWYFPEGTGMWLIYGLPVWLITTIGVVVTMAIFTVWVIKTYWKD